MISQSDLYNYLIKLNNNLTNDIIFNELYETLYNIVCCEQEQNNNKKELLKD